MVSLLIGAIWTRQRTTQTMQSEKHRVHPRPTDEHFLPHFHLWVGRAQPTRGQLPRRAWVKNYLPGDHKNIASLVQHTETRKLQSTSQLGREGEKRYWFCPLSHCWRWGAAWPYNRKNDLSGPRGDHNRSKLWNSSRCGRYQPPTAHLRLRIPRKTQTYRILMDSQRKNACR
jgi:hypothetical protein